MHICTQCIYVLSTEPIAICTCEACPKFQTFNVVVFLSVARQISIFIIVAQCVL